MRSKTWGASDALAKASTTCSSVPVYPLNAVLSAPLVLKFAAVRFGNCSSQFLRQLVIGSLPLTFSHVVRT